MDGWIHQGQDRSRIGSGLQARDATFMEEIVRASIATVPTGHATSPVMAELVSIYRQRWVFLEWAYQCEQRITQLMRENEERERVNRQAQRAAAEQAERDRLEEQRRDIEGYEREMRRRQADRR